MRNILLVALLKQELDIPLLFTPNISSSLLNQSRIFGWIYTPLTKGRTDTYQAGSDGACGEHGDPIIGRDGGALHVGVCQAQEPRTRMISYD